MDSRFVSVAINLHGIHISETHSVVVIKIELRHLLQSPKLLWNYILFGFLF